jgi:galactokinase
MSSMLPRASHLWWFWGHLPGADRKAILGQYGSPKDHRRSVAPVNGPISTRSARSAQLLARLRDGGPVDRAQVFLVTAPLRICPLGAHVDHQGGIVTGMTVDRRVLMAGVPERNAVIRVSSLDFPGEVVVGLENPVAAKVGDWGDYVRAAVAALSREHPIRNGLRAVIGGDLPGAGLSSSAAVLITYLLALTRVNEIEINREEISALVQRAENEYVGVASGRLDQSIILFAEQERLTRVDCLSLNIEQVSRPPGSGEFRVLVAFSGVGRALAGSGFNTRVNECHEAARLLLELADETPRERPVLSDVPPEIFEEFAADLPEAQRRRAAHYFGEQQRVLEAVEAWRSGDLERFGALMTASGASSIHNYESGTAELVRLYELLRGAPGVYGTRFSGGGFGGSCIALIAPEAGESVIEEVRRGYQATHPEAAVNASFHVCRSGGPAQVEHLEG